MKLPNFFIIGAPKSGTTSMYHWLAEHPRIFMSTPKELEFFSKDLKTGDIETFEKYKQFFEGASDRHYAVGEGSVWYLYSEEAVPKIEKMFSEPKYIVMVRDPVEIAISLHAQLLYAKQENVQSFEKAWKMSSKRRRGVHTPYLCVEPKVLDYINVCSLGSQIERLLATVPRNRVHFISLDDIKKDPKKTYVNTLKFLNVNGDERKNFGNKNPATQWSSEAAGTTVFLIRRFLSFFKHNIGIQINPEVGILEKIKNVFTTNANNEAVARSIRKRVRKDLNQEIKKMNDILKDEIQHKITKHENETKTYT